jgi:hypothetical protein
MYSHAPPAHQTPDKTLTFILGLGFKKGKKFTQVDLATGEERWFVWRGWALWLLPLGRKEGVIPGAHVAHPCRLYRGL